MFVDATRASPPRLRQSFGAARLLSIAMTVPVNPPAVGYSLSSASRTFAASSSGEKGF